MELTQGHKDDFEKKIVEIILASLDNKSITEGDLPQISNFVLAKIDEVVTEEEFIDFINELSIRWKIFAPLVTLHKGENKEKEEEVALVQISQAAQQGDIEKALQMAKSATQGV